MVSRKGESKILGFTKAKTLDHLIHQALSIIFPLQQNIKVEKQTWTAKKETTERLTLHRKSKAVWSKKCTMQCKFFGDLFFRFWLDLSLRCWFIFLLGFRSYSTSTLTGFDGLCIASKQWLRVSIDPQKIIFIGVSSAISKESMFSLIDILR
jgi:hypothetical protein